MSLLRRYQVTKLCACNDTGGRELSPKDSVQIGIWKWGKPQRNKSTNRGRWHLAWRILSGWAKLKRGSSAGNQKRHKKSVPLQTLYAQYSDQFIPGFKQLTATYITKLYRNELVSISQPGAYMGIWQLFQTANILQVPVHSIYPEKKQPELALWFPAYYVSHRQWTLFDWSIHHVDLHQPYPWCPKPLRTTSADCM